MRGRLIHTIIQGKRLQKIVKNQLSVMTHSHSPTQKVLKASHHIQSVLHNEEKPLPGSNTEQDLKNSEAQQLIPLTQKSYWKRLDDRYQQGKKNKPTSEEFLQFFLKSVVYGGTIYLVGHAMSEYTEAEKRLDKIDLLLEQKAGENNACLEKMRVLRIQPQLYLTTQINKYDKEEYEKNQSNFIQQRHQLTQFHKELMELEQHLEKTFFVYQKKELQNRLQSLHKIVKNQQNQLKTAQTLDESIWLQKNRHYQDALSKINIIIDELKGYKSENTPAVFNVDRTLASAYNARAKLQACLAIVNEKEIKEIEARRKDSLDSYNEAIALLKNDKDNQNEYAILLSSKAYLLADCDKPAEALLLHQEANNLKPNDEHILCGIGRDLYDIEHKKSSAMRDLSKLDEAYGYLTRSLQLNAQVPNIYVARGKLLVDLGDLEGAMVDFDQALKLDNSLSDAHIQKAKLLITKKDCDQADKHFRLGLLPLIDQPHQVEQQKMQLTNIVKSLLPSCDLLSQETFFNSRMKHHQTKSPDITVFSIPASTSIAQKKS